MGGGSININAKNLSITSGSSFFGGINIDSGFSEAQSGDFTINLTEDLIIDGLDSEDLTSIINNSFGQGNPGNIDINARNITFQNGGNVGIFIDTEQENINIGNITLNATGNITFDGLKNNQRSGILNSLTQENTSGKIGEINIKAQNLTLTNGAQIRSLIPGVADSGDININVANSIKVDGFGSFSPEEVLPSEISTNITGTGQGNAGSININTSSLHLSRNGRIFATITGQGNGGDININAEQITIGEQGNTSLLPSNISADVIGAIGNGGNIEIDTTNLTINNNAFISAEIINSTGDGGLITISANDSVEVLGDSYISAGVFNSTGNGGAITISANDSVEVLEGSVILANVTQDSTGKGGNLTIETGKLTVTEGSQISASTFGQGNAGTLTIRATDSIELSGGNSLVRSGLFASALEQDGNSGELNVFTQDLRISDGATINVGNFQSLGLTAPGTGEAGSLFIEANNIILENGGRITAATQAGDNGNITLQVAENIILRDNSFISAQAFKDATGGNLDIDTRFIIAFPDQNNDIIASAERGDGGNIDITAEALFGIEERPLNPVTNDINASSETGLPGDINIQQPTVDPVGGLLELTEEVVDPAKLIAQNVCTQTANSEFIDIGKGGLPPNPNDVLAEDNIEVELVAPITVSAEEIQSNREIVAVKPIINRKPPAQGWIFHENGMVELVAYNPNQVGEPRTWESQRGCE